MISRQNQQNNLSQNVNGNLIEQVSQEQITDFSINNSFFPLNNNEYRSVIHQIQKESQQSYQNGMQRLKKLDMKQANTLGVIRYRKQNVLNKVFKEQQQSLINTTGNIDGFGQKTIQTQQQQHRQQLLSQNSLNVSQSKVNFSLIASPEGSVPRLNLQPILLKRSSKLGQHRFSADQSYLNNIIRPQYGIDSQQTSNQRQFTWQQENNKLFYQPLLHQQVQTSQPTHRFHKNGLNSNIMVQNQRKNIFKEKRMYQSIDYSDKNTNQNAKSINNSREISLEKGVILTDKWRRKIKKLGGIKSKEIIKEVEQMYDYSMLKGLNVKDILKNQVGTNRKFRYYGDKQKNQIDVNQSKSNLNGFFDDLQRDYQESCIDQ
eukprot:403367404